MKKCVYVKVTHKFIFNTGEVEAEGSSVRPSSVIQQVWSQPGIHTQDPVSKLKSQQVETPAINPNKLSSIIKSWKKEKADSLKLFFDLCVYVHAHKMNKHKIQNKMAYKVAHHRAQEAEAANLYEFEVSLVYWPYSRPVILKSWLGGRSRRIMRASDMYTC